MSCTGLNTDNMCPLLQVPCETVFSQLVVSKGCHQRDMDCAPVSGCRSLHIQHVSVPVAGALVAPLQSSKPKNKNCNAVPQDWLLSLKCGGVWPACLLHPGKLLVRFYGEHSSSWAAIKQLTGWDECSEAQQLEALRLWGKKANK